MYVMFQLRPFTVHNVFPCFYGPNKVIYMFSLNVVFDYFFTDTLWLLDDYMHTCWHTPEHIAHTQINPFVYVLVCMYTVCRSYM